MDTHTETTPCLPDDPLEACKKLREANGIDEVQSCEKECSQVSTCPNAVWCRYMEGSSVQSAAALEQAAAEEQALSSYEQGHCTF